MFLSFTELPTGHPEMVLSKGIIARSNVWLLELDAILWIWFFGTTMHPLLVRRQAFLHIRHYTITSAEVPWINKSCQTKSKYGRLLWLDSRSWSSREMAIARPHGSLERLRRLLIQELLRWIMSIADIRELPGDVFDNSGSKEEETKVTSESWRSKRVRAELWRCDSLDYE